MYLYFNKEGKLQTAIAHGNPVRQGDSFGLYVCFDLDYFSCRGLNANNFTLNLHYKKPSQTNFTVYKAFNNPVNKKFSKIYDSEVTYKLIDEKYYFTYYASVDAISGITSENGTLNLILEFITSDNTYTISNGTIVVNAQQPAFVMNLSAAVYVEPTYGKFEVNTDGSENSDNLSLFKSMIANLNYTKNIMLVKSDETELVDRAEEIFTEYGTAPEGQDAIYTGWLLVGVKPTTQTDIETGNNVEDFTYYTVENKKTDLYMILDNQNMLVIEGATGKMYNYNGGALTQLTYNKEEIDEALRIINVDIDYIEDNAIFSVTYDNGSFYIKQGKNGSVQTLASKTTLKNDLGMTTFETDMYNVKNHGAFDIEYDKVVEDTENEATTLDSALKVKKGIDNTQETLFTAQSLKEDMKLGNLQTLGQDDIIYNSNQYVATLKAVFDTLEKGATGSGANPNTVQYNEMMRKIRYMYNYFQESGEDIDNKINKLEEIINVLDNMPENYNIYDMINDVYNRIGETDEGQYFYRASWSDDEKARMSIKGRIQELEQNADCHILNILHYDQNQQLFTLNNWQLLTEPNIDYPDATYYATIQSNVFKDVLDAEVIFDKSVEQSVMLGAVLDTNTGIFTFYAIEEPEEPITIDTIKMISDLYHIDVLGTDTINQVDDNTEDIASNTNSIANLAQTKQEKANLTTSWGSTLSDTKYPSEKLVKDSLDAKGSLVASFQVTPDNTHYPSEKLVKDFLDTKVNETNVFGNDGKTTIKSYNVSGNTTLSIVTEKDAWNYSSINIGKASITMYSNQKINDNTNQSYFSLTPTITYFETSSLERHISGDIYKIPYINDFNEVVNNRGETYSREKIDALLNQKQTNNLVATFQATPDDTHYPSEKLVKDSLDAKGTLVDAFTGNVSDDTTYPSAKLVFGVLSSFENRIDLLAGKNKKVFEKKDDDVVFWNGYQLWNVSNGSIVYGIITDATLDGQGYVQSIVGTKLAYFSIVYYDNGTTKTSQTVKLGTSDCTISFVDAHVGVNIEVSGNAAFLLIRIISV